MNSPNLIIETCGKANVVFTSRENGFSQPPFDYLNVGLHVGDDSNDVKMNRRVIYSTLENSFVDIPKLDKWLFLDQRHCDTIFEPDFKEYDEENLPISDASITSKKNTALVTMTADCGPLVVQCGNIMASIHASAKTVELGLIDKMISKIRSFDSNSQMYCLLGPCIHAENYEYEQKYLDQLANKLGEHIKSKTFDGKPAFNLPEAIQFECEKFGADFRDIDIDTFTNKDYFSYRRDNLTGRQCTISWM